MSNENSWNRPWTTQEIINNSENWSLAGDVALLNTLKHFANNLLTKTDQINDNINNLLNNLDEVGLKLDISQNEFQSLKNTQFIESRVYDDDETLDSKGAEDRVSINSSQKEDEKSLDISLTAELQLLDKYYETVEISVSDSEDESEKSFVLKPKDIYEDRILPPIIGSEEWYKNWYLDEADSDVDSQKSEDVYSESDSDDNLPKDLIISESSSELDFSPQNNENRPLANSTMKGSKKKPESVSSSDESEEQRYSGSTKVPSSNKAFAEQLTAKLDSVISRQEHVEENINSKPIQPTKSNTFSAGLFSDEPPPLDYPEDTMKGIFSTNKNLFDEDEDEYSLFGDTANKVPPSNKEENTNATNDSKSIKSDVFTKTSQLSKGLFDSEDSDDDDIFTVKKEKKNTFLQPTKTIVPLIDNEPPSLENDKVDQPVKKKPIGGVSILGNQNISDILKKKQEISNQSPEKDTPKNAPVTFPKDTVPQKQYNLFEETENLFTNIESKPKQKQPKQQHLFDDDEEIEEATNNKAIKNISNVAKTDLVAQRSKIKGLFDETDDDSDDDIFNKTKKTGSTKTNQNKKYDLFGDTEDFSDQDNSIISNKNSLFSDFEDKRVLEDTVENFNRSQGKQENNSKKDIEANQKPVLEKEEIIKIKNENDVLPVETTTTRKDSQQSNLFEKDDMKDQLVNENINKKNKSKKISLFDDDDDDEEDDLFSNATKKIDFKLFEEPESTDDLFTIKTEVEHETIKTAHVEKTEKFITNKSVDEESTRDITKAEIDIKRESGVSAIATTKHLPDVVTKDIEKHSVSEWDENSDFKPTNESLLTDDLFEKEKKVERNDTVKVKEEVSTKPTVAEKPTTKHVNTEPFQSTVVTSTAASPVAPVPPVSLFDSTPPPDDDDWDTKSETFSDTEDFLSYRAVESSNTRANLFDDEPPSLFGDDSSDVGDIKNTKIESNDLSPAQDTSSSHQLSSDLLSGGDSQAAENEMNNSNKNKSETVASKQEVLDKTQKGEKEMEGSPRRIASITEMLKSQGQKDATDHKVIPGKLKQNLNINVKALLPGQSQPKISSLRKSLSLDSASEDEINDSKEFITSPSMKTPSYKSSPSENPQKPVDFDETDNVKVLESITKERVRIPVKRRPSTRKGRQEALRKSAIDMSLDSVDEAERLSVQHEKAILKTTESPVPSSTSVTTAVTVPGSAELKNTLANTLDSAISQKDLTKQVFQNKEADNIDRLFESEKILPKEDKSEKSNNNKDEDLFATISKKESKQPKYTSNDDDIFTSESSSQLFEKPAFQKKNTSDFDDLFNQTTASNQPTQPDIQKEDSSNRNNDFAAPKELPKSDVTINTKANSSLNLESSTNESTKPIAHKQIPSSKPSIFDSGDDSDDDLFKSSNKSKPKDVSVTKDQTHNVQTKKSTTKHSLFDDNSSDDDLFTGTSSRRKDRTETTPKVSDKKIKPSIKKLENVQTDVDPLSSLLE